MGHEITFISSALQQPRHQKRIDLLNKHFKTQVIYCERKKYENNIKEYSNGAISLGLAEDGKYLSRIKILLKLIALLRKSSAKIIYCTAPDQAIASIISGKKFILELGDLNQLDGKGRFFQVFDKIICKKLSGLVLTSPFFYSEYYSKKHPDINKKTIIVENKLPQKEISQIEHYRSTLNIGISDGKIKLGLIGSLSFRRPLEFIRDLVISRKDVELHIFGDGLVDIFKNTERCFYHGPFRSPEDLPSIYKKIDINLVIYESLNNNVKLALPNKLYESIAFSRPIICAKGVALSDIVEKNKYGLSAPYSEIGTAIDLIINNYSDYQLSLLSKPKEYYIDDSEKKIPPLIRRAIT